MTNESRELLARIGTALYEPDALTRQDADALYDTLDALVAEVDRLRKQNHALRTAEQDARDAEQGAAACDQIESLLDGVSLENPCPEAARVAALLSERNRLREEAHTMRLWAEEAARAENANAEDAKKERAAVVAWLRERAMVAPNERSCLLQEALAYSIEIGAHRREEEP